MTGEKITSKSFLNLNPSILILIFRPPLNTPGDEISLPDIAKEDHDQVTRRII
jgi:hypothetical protein